MGQQGKQGTRKWAVHGLPQSPFLGADIRTVEGAFDQVRGASVSQKQLLKFYNTSKTLSRLSLECRRQNKGGVQMGGRAKEENRRGKREERKGEGRKEVEGRHYRDSRLHQSWPADQPGTKHNEFKLHSPLSHWLTSWKGEGRQEELKRLHFIKKLHT